MAGTLSRTSSQMNIRLVSDTHLHLWQTSRWEVMDLRGRQLSQDINKACIPTWCWTQKQFCLIVFTYLPVILVIIIVTFVLWVFYIVQLFMITQLDRITVNGLCKCYTRCKIRKNETDGKTEIMIVYKIEWFTVFFPQWRP